MVSGHSQLALTLGPSEQEPISACGQYYVSIPWPLNPLAKRHACSQGTSALQFQRQKAVRKYIRWEPQGLLHDTNCSRSQERMATEKQEMSVASFLTSQAIG